MSTAFCRRLPLIVLLGLCFSVISCDSESPSDSTSDWVGKWEIVAVNPVDPLTDPTYWNLTEKELKVVEDETNEDSQDEPCDLFTFDVKEMDGNTVGFRGTTEQFFGIQEFTLRFEVSGETLTATVVEADDARAIGIEITLSPVGEIPVPQDEDTCRTP